MLAALIFIPSVGHAEERFAPFNQVRFLNVIKNYCSEDHPELRKISIDQRQACLNIDPNQIGNVDLGIFGFDRHSIFKLALLDLKYPLECPILSGTMWVDTVGDVLGEACQYTRRKSLKFDKNPPLTFDTDCIAQGFKDFNERWNKTTCGEVR